MHPFTLMFRLVRPRPVQGIWAGVYRFSNYDGSSMSM
jgi:hypothetical protein